MSRFEALRSGTTPLVGRHEELDLLLRRWQQAKSGEGRVVLVSGEPGIGKSRLTATLSQRIESEPSDGAFEIRPQCFRFGHRGTRFCASLRKFSGARLKSTISIV